METMTTTFNRTGNVNLLTAAECLVQQTIGVNIQCLWVARRLTKRLHCKTILTLLQAVTEFDVPVK